MGDLPGLLPRLEGRSNRTRGATEQRGEEEKESRRGGMGRKNPKLRSQLPPFGTPVFEIVQLPPF